MNRRSAGYLWLSGVVYALALLALVVLEVAGRDTTALLSLVGPVIAALFIAGHVDRVTGEQNEAIGRIERQTNGVLDQRIKDGTAEAIKTLLPDLVRETPQDATPSTVSRSLSSPMAP